MKKSPLYLGFAYNAANLIPNCLRLIGCFWELKLERERPGQGKTGPFAFS
jgi:hypothetical protein